MAEIKDHLLMQDHAGLDMKRLYQKLGCVATSTNADTVLIRSHLAYWGTQAIAAEATIKPSRGHSYRVTQNGTDRIVRITDHYDHRFGVVGLYVTDKTKQG